MPFLRFSRDKRGYENTYVLHTYRREGRSHPRLLYWFRTPPGVRVGRHPLDERAIKAIEEGNPNLSFDWSKMLKVRPAPAPDETRRSRGKKGTKPPPAQGQKKSRGGVAGRQATAQPPRPRTEEPPPETAESPENLDETAPVTAFAPDQPVEELVADVTGAVRVDPVAPDESVLDEPWQHPVVTLMGEEMLARLRARYAELQVRIAEKQTDPETLDAIRGRVETLDPDRWKTVQDAVEGIERFESEAEAIKGTLGRRPPRPRKT